MARHDFEDDELPIPNGCFAVGWSHELREGAVKPNRYFGAERVLFRTRSGAAKVLDPFSPHLGAHFGYGERVMRETLCRPFHGWQLDGTRGECTQIPCCERMPQAARVRSWVVQEKNGLIWTRYHDRGEAPREREAPFGTFDPSLVRDSCGLGPNALWTKGIPDGEAAAAVAS